MIDSGSKEILRIKFKESISIYGANSLFFKIYNNSSYIMCGEGRDEFPVYSSYNKKPYDIYDKEELASLAEQFGIRHNLTF